MVHWLSEERREMYAKDRRWRAEIDMVADDRLSGNSLTIPTWVETESSLMRSSKRSVVVKESRSLDKEACPEVVCVSP